MGPEPLDHVTDGWDMLRTGARHQRPPRPPRGELTQQELHDFLVQVGADMRCARFKAGLTQEQVAALMDTTKSAVSRLERLDPNVPSLTTLCRYANSIGCRLRVEFVSRHPSPLWWEE